MEQSRTRLPLNSRPTPPWNKGALVGPKPPLKPKQVWSIRLTLQRDERLRDLAMFDLAIDSKLRGCDLVKPKIGEVVIGAAAPSPSHGRAAEDPQTGAVRADRADPGQSDRVAHSPGR